MEGGDRSGVALELGGDLTLLVQKGEEQNVRLVPQLPASVAAPVEKGQQVGSVEVELDGRVLARIPVLAVDAVTARGLSNALMRIWRRWTL